MDSFTQGAGGDRCDILVVDDDVDIRDTLIELLGFEGYTSRGAANGQEALEFLSRCRPFVILLDLMMPIMDGFEFRKRQLQDPELKDIPVVVVSAGGQCERSAQQLGARGCVRKPLNVRQLFGLIQAARDGAEAKREGADGAGATSDGADASGRE